MNQNTKLYNWNMTMSGTNNVDNSIVSTIKRVTWIGFWVNAVLMVLKIFFGWYGHSDALVAGGVHSLSDFATDFIVLVFVGLAYKHADDSHPYGHGKYETFATLLIAVALLIVAVGLGIGGVRTIMAFVDGSVLPRPDIWTLVVAIVSILAKEYLFRYTVKAGRRINSSSLIANAWHHRSDAISSIATLVGVSASYFLGEQWRILDPVASLLIAAFIVISAVQIGRPAINELLEQSLPEDEVMRISDIIKSVGGVKGLHNLRTRRNGHTVMIDCHVKVDPYITVTEGHDIASAAESGLRDLYGYDTVITIHIEPFKGI